MPPLDPDLYRDIVRRALDLGVNWIDTAAQYGFGHSEEVVGRAIASLDERPFIFTKGGQPEGPGGATLHDVDLMRRTVGDDMGVKAAGGVRDLEGVKAMIAAGATRAAISWQRAGRQSNQRRTATTGCAIAGRHRLQRVENKVRTWIPRKGAL